MACTSLGLESAEPEAGEGIRVLTSLGREAL